MPAALPVPAALFLALAAPSPAVDSTPLRQRIDTLIAARHPGYAKAAAPVCDDAEFVRRVHLDLNGSIPAPAEVTRFLADKDPAKREKLIDKLLAAPGYGRRMAYHFDVVLMERRAGNKVSQGDWEQYLRQAFAANTPYDRLARDLLAADGVDAKTRPAAKFFLDRDFEPNLVTKDLARVFLGTNLQCAQCHDHPTIEAYRQEHYYGILAFLNRSFLFPTARVPTAVLAEKADGDVNFVSVFDKAKLTKYATPKLPNGKPLDEPKMEKGKEYKVAPAKDVRPVPAYSRRAQLAAAVTAAENKAFARTAANRMWALMLGRGIVHPVDMDHPDNPPSHPELLDMLAKEFASHQFDVKWLLREIALSKTYQRSSVVPAGFVGEPPADRYLVANLKPLTPEQMAYAVSLATTPGDANVPAVEKAAAGRVPQFRTVYGGVAGEPDDGTNPTLDQTLFLKFGSVVRGLTAPAGVELAKQTDDAKLADDLFLAVLSRPATADERADVAAALAGATDRPAAVGELVWALIASGEFRFNH